MGRKPKPGKQEKQDAKALALNAKQTAYEKNVLEVGMSPYNAALVAGFTPTEALNKSAEDMAKQVFGGMEFKDLAERQAITPKRIIEYLATRAGFFDRENGAKKVVGLTPILKKEVKRLLVTEDADLPNASPLEWEWVEVPDDGVQQKYMAMLLDFLQYTGQAKPGNEVPIGNGARAFSVHFHVLPEDGKELAHKTLELGAAHVNGNGTHFKVVDP